VQVRTTMYETRRPVMPMDAQFRERSRLSSVQSHSNVPKRSS